MTRRARGALLPAEMQGRWVSETDPAYEVIVTGSELKMHGHEVKYDHREEFPQGNLLMVEFYRRDTRYPSYTENIINFVVLPDGKLAFFSDNDGGTLVRVPL